MPPTAEQLASRIKGLEDFLNSYIARLVATEASLRDEAGFRERFLAILAHDLRQPLNVFALGSETLAAADTPQDVRDRVKHHFDKATGRMQRMIGELLDFSRSRPQGGLLRCGIPMDQLL